MKRWQLWMDTGGTFTDCLAVSPQRKLMHLKILSHAALRGTVLQQQTPTQIQTNIRWPVMHFDYRNFTLVHSTGKCLIRKVDHDGVIHLQQPDTLQAGQTIEVTSGEEVVVMAARLLTGTPLGRTFPPMDVRLGSTRGTNALLERKGARTVLIITKGFKDLLEIGTQQRPDLFTLNIKKEEPLYVASLEAHERILANGKIRLRLTVTHTRQLIAQAKKLKAEAVAIALLHSYKYPVHEKQLARAFRQAGFRYVSASHELSRQAKILPRAQTTVINAYLQPVISGYLAGIQKRMPSAKLMVMNSAGGLMTAQAFKPKDSLLSGPAGGMVGAASTGLQAGQANLITFDMGGTSTDVAVYQRQFDYRFETQVGQQTIFSPSLAIDTIAAGGGSICRFDGFKFTVGPDSAGANPGPACYGAGGPLTLTDINLLAGKLTAESFVVPLHYERARQALQEILRQVETETGKALSAKAALRAFTQIADEKMGEAIRKISVQRGHNPARFTLLCFGGAGGQHACALAQVLAIKKIVVPFRAGLLSAYGIGQATVDRFEDVAVMQPLGAYAYKLKALFRSLQRNALRKLKAEGHSTARFTASYFLFLRFRGQESSLEIGWHAHHTSAQLQAIFRKTYTRLFGHWPDREVEIESARVKVELSTPFFSERKQHQRTYAPRPWQGKQQGKLFRWEDLSPGATIAGPAVLASENSTVAVARGWRVQLDGYRHATLTQTAAPRRQRQAAEAELELFTNRFTAVAQEMGAMLQRTAFSVNVKERLDFSCALLDARGQLIVNAPHIPVHLGSLGVCVRAVARHLPLKAGDVAMTNHPAYGGSHLPDITLIKPVYQGKTKIGYVAARAHHAEIGGRVPGSMPAHARDLREEGVVIVPTYLVRGGKADWLRVKEIFTSAPYPTRAWHENQADLNAALAALQTGEAALQHLCLQHGTGYVIQQMQALTHYGARLMAATIKALPAQTRSAKEFLDDGTPLSVRVSKRGDRLHIHYHSPPQHPGNLNATPAIVQSVTLYVLRLLLQQSLPMNEGLLANIKLIISPGSLAPDFRNARHWPAVVGGNTEVSQRLTDTLIKAFGLAACSQGTMNNVIFGNDHFGYYETICGGVGAGRGFQGASAVHQHMTNTRITDPELLELRYPVRLLSFAIRKNSGGHGQWRGGDGVMRAIEFREPVQVNILSQHRIEKPYGLKGGQPGKVGRQYVLQPSGSRRQLRGIDHYAAAPGDILIIETPGGGGFGRIRRK